MVEAEREREMVKAEGCRQSKRWCREKGNMVQAEEKMVWAEEKML